MSKIVEIILPLNLDKTFSYIADDNMQIGDLVEVPFGNKKLFGVIFKQIEKVDFPVTKLKKINLVISKKLFSNQYLEFIIYFAKYNITNIGNILSNLLPAKEIIYYKPIISLYSLGSHKSSKISKQEQILLNWFNNKTEITEEEFNYNILSKSYINSKVRSGFLVKTEKLAKTTIETNIKYTPPPFSPQQNNVIEQLKLQTFNFKVNFLHGVTGSGKTEIYFAYLAHIINSSSKQAIILLPEILLTNQFLTKFKKRFEINPAIWHSNITNKKKREIWHGFSNGEIKILIGARSALFVPALNLGLIVIDEEHDQSYKQEDNLVYNARDMAISLAYKLDIPILLASATPSIETKVNCNLKKYNQINLPNRFAGKLPKTHIIDMKSQLLEKNKSISQPLLDAIAENLRKGQQSMIYINRRGYAPLKICNSCGYRFKCENCDSWLVEHKKSKLLICHHCQYSIKDTNICLACKKKDSLISFGYAVERILEEINEIFPQAKATILTGENTKNQTQLSQFLSDVENKKIDIIIGTQVIVKGHHFSHLTLVGILDGDISNIEDLRCNEKMFQIIHQISGRAGREIDNSNVFIQTYNPDTSFINAIEKGNIEQFYQNEILNREKYNLPPFSKFIAIIISSTEELKSKNCAHNISKDLLKYQNFKTLGPIKAPIYFLRNRYRYRILIKTSRNHNLTKLILNIVEKYKDPKLSIKIDVDPISFM